MRDVLIYFIDIDVSEFMILGNLFPVNTLGGQKVQLQHFMMCNSYYVKLNIDFATGSNVTSNVELLLNERYSVTS